MSIKTTLDAWARQFLDDSAIPEDARFEIEDDTSGGCPTCGPNYEVEVTAWWREPNAAGASVQKYRRKNWIGRFGELIEEIVRWEEERDEHADDL